MATYPLRTRRWTRAEYGRLIDIGGVIHLERHVFSAEAIVELLAAPGARVLVSDFLP